MRVDLFASMMLAVASMASPAGDEASTVLRGIDPLQFELVGIGPESIAIEGDEIRLTGKPLGYFATRAEYRDFILTFEYQYDRPEGLKSDGEFRGNSGVLLRLVPPHKVWPRCVQVQLAQADPGAIFAMGDAACEAQVDPEAQRKAVRPVGEWNRVDVTCRGGSIACVMDGVEVAKAGGAQPDRGAIGWQSEGKPIRFRSIRIKPLP